MRKNIEGYTEVLRKIETEKEPYYTSKIRLSFMRHNRAGKYPKDDRPVRLLPEGKSSARQKSTRDDISQSVAFGGGRVRALETAAWHMAGKQEGITGEETLEELQEKIDKDVKVGSKLGIDSRLDFVLEANSEYESKVFEAWDKERILDFLANESDKLAKELDDKNSITYSRAAGNIAKIVQQYINVAPRWDKLVQENPDKYTKILDRLRGSHQAILESFLLKVVDKIKGKEEREKLIEELGHTGFDYSEGFDIDILNTPEQGILIKIDYSKEKETKLVYTLSELVPISVIDDIVAESKI